MIMFAVNQNEEIMSDKKIYFRKREFLNDLDVLPYPSAIVGEIEREAHWICSTFKISGCTSILELEFPVDKEEEYEHSLRKCDKLVAFIMDFRYALMAARKDHKKKEDK
jgi:hypothetical protein